MNDSTCEIDHDAPQPQSDERRNALESLLPGRAVNAAQTDWGKGYIEGWMARAKSQPQSAVIAEICSAFIELVDEYHAPDWDTNCRLCQLRTIAHNYQNEDLRKSEELHSAWQAWLDDFGVPISTEFVRLANAIGEFTKAVRAKSQAKEGEAHDRSSKNS